MAPEDIQGALWKRSLIDALRVRVQELPPLKRIVVTIDPTGSSEEDSNECGIIWLLALRQKLSVIRPQRAQSCPDTVLD